eukprot:CAMPEP_0180191048 /NCGR_PEP_ID=MMETSP0987-20121128/1216_1 /TAXON_ID=697907 /ORGANISM="non described non described, Strain CCMP2293" /LENGTH=475 /DNA_ID=CAMNT_0022145537 /DNA_START=62 /DNA_END=1485 /DNA_ORIENTATION=+
MAWASSPGAGGVKQGKVRNGKGAKKSKNKFKNGAARDIDAELRSKRALLTKRIDFVPAKRKENGDVVAMRLGAGANGSPSGGAAKPGQCREEDFQEIDAPLYPQTRLKKLLEWQKVTKIGPGLLNLGNTCFCNSILQCLAYTPPLANFCLNNTHSKRVPGGRPLKLKFDALAAMERHVVQVFSEKKSTLKPSAFTGALSKIGSKLRIGRQEDAHEFLRLVMEGMHLADLGAVRFDSSPYSRHAQTGVMHGIFGGHLRSQVRCENCQFNSNTYDAFLDISLEIKKTASIDGAFQNFTKKEVLDGPNKYKCSNCGVKSRATKQFTVHRAPLILSIHLKRFESSWGGKASKINKHVKFEPVLSIKNYMSETEQGSGQCTQYGLYAVLVHTGASTRSGHYFAFVKNSNGVWYEMNDDFVRQVSNKMVETQNAYMLFYKQQPGTSHNSPALAPRPGASPLLRAQVRGSSPDFGAFSLSAS